MSMPRSQLAYEDLSRPDFVKSATEKREPAYIADLARISVPIAHWARKRLAEGFTIDAVNDALKVANHRAIAHRLKS